MKYRKLGRTGFEVSEVGLGSWVFGGDAWGDIDEQISIKVIKEALEKGVNFIDTAPVYGAGRAESIIGRAIANRDKVFIATKCGLEIEGGSIRPNLQPGFIRQEIENSLERLKTDHIDLYQCHWPDPNTPIEETMKELELLKKEGKIRNIGVSNFEPDLLEESFKFADIQSDQMQYSLLKRDIEKDIIPFAKEKDISIIPYGVLGGGILTGKYEKVPGLKKKDPRSFFYRFYKEPLWSRVQQLVEVLKLIAEEKDVFPVNIAMRWILSENIIASCLVGCRTLEQLKMNMKTERTHLDGRDLARINEASKNILDN